MSKSNGWREKPDIHGRAGQDIRRPAGWSKLACLIRERGSYNPGVY